jgi:hypothetical protein
VVSSAISKSGASQQTRSLRQVVPPSANYYLFHTGVRLPHMLTDTTNGTTPTKPKEMKK